MKDENMSSIYNGAWERLKALNGKTIELITKKFPSINGGLPVVFTIEGVFSGDSTKYNYSGSEVCIETGGTVKFHILDLENTSTSIGANDMNAPTENIKSFIENIKIDGVSYKIDNEKKGGFGNLVMLEIIRR